MRHALTALLLAATTSAAALAQEQTSGPILTLEEAVQLSMRNNPTHLTALSQRDRTSAQLRTAYGQWLPQVNSSFGSSFTKGGPLVFDGQQIGSNPDQLGSSYSISAGVSFNGSSLMRPRSARANLNAADAEVRGSEATTRAQVVTFYLDALQAQAQVALQDTLLANQQAQLDLNRAREQVGAGTALDVRNAEVTVGTQRLAVLQARNRAANALMVLFQQMGVPQPEGVRLVTTFPMAEPTLQLEELLAMARGGNPVLNAARARESAASVQVAMARSRWLPTLSLSTGWSGFTNRVTDIDPQIASAAAGRTNSRRSCFTSDSIRSGAGLAPLGGCDGIVFTDADAAALRAANDKYPFSFTKQPFGYRVSVSLPIFDGFSREEGIQAAQAQRNESRYAVRRQELQLTTDVTTAYRNLVTQYEAVALQQQTRDAAQQALALAQERYRVGASTFIEVSTARNNFERAGTDLINAIYDFHKFFAALEQAVGRPLR
ncbi:MAG TPA: TolC family protein [Gemmatimonadaceae bacterium]